MEEFQDNNSAFCSKECDNTVIKQLVYDFILLDTWSIPLKTSLNQQLNLENVLKVIMSKNENPTILDKLSEFLFKLRMLLGKLFGWDNDLNTLPIPGCKETSLKDRIKTLRLTDQIEELALSSDSKPDMFSTVFSKKNERLLEISNNTVHGLLHYQLASKTEFEYQLKLSIYVKTRGWLGAFYMKLITPFRHLIVYPALVNNANRNWENHLKKS